MPILAKILPFRLVDLHCQAYRTNCCQDLQTKCKLRRGSSIPLVQKRTPQFMLHWRYTNWCFDYRAFSKARLGACFFTNHRESWRSIALSRSVCRDFKGKIYEESHPHPMFLPPQVSVRYNLSIWLWHLLLVKYGNCPLEPSKSSRQPLHGNNKKNNLLFSLLEGESWKKSTLKEISVFETLKEDNWRI